MRKIRTDIVFPLFTLTAILLCSCTMARMAMPSGLSATEMPIEGRKTFGLSEAFQFGDYSVHHVHRGWKKKTKIDILGFGASHANQQYEFTLDTARGPWTAQCADGVKWKELNFSNFLDSGGTLTTELTSDTILICNFESGEQSWKLAMNQEKKSLVLSGVLTDGITQIKVEGTRALQGSNFPLMDPTGYIFRKDGQPIGAVEVINKGAVWMDASLADEVRDGLANASAALQLYRDLKN